MLDTGLPLSSCVCMFVCIARGLRKGITDDKGNKLKVKCSEQGFKALQIVTHITLQPLNVDGGRQLYSSNIVNVLGK